MWLCCGGALGNLCLGTPLLISVTWLLDSYFFLNLCLWSRGAGDAGLLSGILEATFYAAKNLVLLQLSSGLFLQIGCLVYYGKILGLRHRHRLFSCSFDFAFSVVSLSCELSSEEMAFGLCLEHFWVVGQLATLTGFFQTKLFALFLMLKYVTLCILYVLFFFPSAQFISGKKFVHGIYIHMYL